MSQKRREASRRNGAKSKGPITPRGKAISSRNAIRHGLLASTVTMRTESDGAFEEFLQELSEVLGPRSVDERAFIESMAVCRWRLERLWAVERYTLENEELRQLAENPELAAEDGPSRTAGAFRFLADNSRTLDVLARYESLYNRGYDRAYRQFLEAREKPQKSQEDPKPGANS